MLGTHPSIVIPQNTEYAKEMRKHEALHTSFGPPGKPYVFREFPKRLYKAVRGEKGIEWDGTTVNDANEQLNMQSRGYCETQPQALEALEAEQREHGRLAAEREWEIRHGRVSENAAREVRQAEAEHGARHLPEVKEKPIRKRQPKQTV